MISILRYPTKEEAAAEAARLNALAIDAGAAIRYEPESNGREWGILRRGLNGDRAGMVIRVPGPVAPTNRKASQ